MSKVSWTALVLLIVGGLNWGLSLWNVNLVTMLLGAWPMVVNVVYGLVGLSALYEIYYLSTM
ncbi:MAG TPA: DUF378 domain-containing protein [Candidatus Nanoarchaeia archaeon]|nr:DUF378 domain-containing protein [Candidatus Nanoarchaeia archaeon]